VLITGARPRHRPLRPCSTTWCAPGWPRPDGTYRVELRTCRPRASPPQVLADYAAARLRPREGVAYADSTSDLPNARAPSGFPVAVNETRLAARPQAGLAGRALRQGVRRPQAPLPIGPRGRSARRGC
jgi:hypothetical protein